jgi:hypothetical protein
MHMDMMSMVTAMMAMKAGGTQTQIATTIMKSNMDAEKSAVTTLLGGAQAALAEGIGGNLDITA